MEIVTFELFKRPCYITKEQIPITCSEENTGQTVTVYSAFKLLIFI